MTDTTNHANMPIPHVYRSVPSLGDACAAEDVEDLKDWARATIAAQSERIAKMEEAGRAARKELAAWVKDHGQDIATNEALALLDAALAKEAQG